LADDALFDYLMKTVEQVVITGDTSRPFPKGFSE
jgi:hypothetical protein